MSTFRFDKPVVFPAKAEHTATCIFLHGLGGNGRHVAPIARTINLPWIKWVFPNAPNRRMTFSGGEPMPAWFDFLPQDNRRRARGRVDDEGIQASADYISRLVRQEMEAGMPSSRIVVGGFSQGGHVAATYALTAKHPPPACLMLSSWLGRLRYEVPQRNKGVQFWMAHGTSDPLISKEMVAVTQRVLKSSGLEVAYREYKGMAHTMDLQELNDLKYFLKMVCPQDELPVPSWEEVEGMSLRELRSLLHKFGVWTENMQMSDLKEAVRRL